MIQAVLLYLFVVALMALGASWLTLHIHGRRVRIANYESLTIERPGKRWPAWWLVRVSLRDLGGKARVWVETRNRYRFFDVVVENLKVENEAA